MTFSRAWMPACESLLTVMSVLIQVMKFGGSSLATPENISRVVDTVLTELSSRPLVVLSAIGKTTDRLIALGVAALEQRETTVEELHQFHMEVRTSAKLSLPSLDLTCTEHIHASQMYIVRCRRFLASCLGRHMLRRDV